MLDEGEPLTGFLALNHEPNTEGSEIDGFPVLGPYDARVPRGLEATRLGSWRVVGRRHLFYVTPPSPSA
jgi:hypothetical protein